MPFFLFLARFLEFVVIGPYRFIRREVDPPELGNAAMGILLGLDVYAVILATHGDLLGAVMVVACRMGLLVLVTLCFLFMVAVIAAFGEEKLFGNEDIHSA